MNNYQLHRSNVLLGGQLKWNISIKSNQSRLEVDNFYLSPISDWVTFNKHVDENLLNYDHRNNIKEFYSKIENSFYSPCVNPRLQLRQPLIVEENEKIDTYNDIYDMGLSRISYKLNKKSFQYFCPLWLEDFNSQDKLRFEFVFRTRYEEGFQEHISKSLIFDLNEIGDSYHHKFVKYLYNYVDYLVGEQQKIGDRLLKVDFKRNFISVEGLDASSGSVRTINTSLTISNLYSRERPLMEFDKLLIDHFPNNRLIAKQLFNFNFLFNMEDIISKRVIDMLYGNYINIAVKVYIQHKDQKEELLDVVDFDSNYEFIDKGDGEVVDILKGTIKRKGSNVLDYLFDYHCIDLVDKNKICPSIIHWSLSDYPGSYFNVYGGFEKYPMFMCGQVDLWSTGKDDNGQPVKFTDFDLAARDWCKCHNAYLNNLGLVLKQSEIVDNSDDSHKYLSYIDLNRKYIRGNKILPISDIPNPISIGSICVSYHPDLSLVDIRDILGATIVNVGRVSEEGEVDSVLKPMYDGYNKIEGLYLYIYNNEESSILFLDITNPDSSKSSQLFYRNFKKTLKDTIDHYNSLTEYSNSKFITTLETLYTYLDNIEEPLIIKIDRGLSIHKANSPSVKSSEIEYEKIKKDYNYHIRYDGAIVPRFINKDFQSYRIKTLTKEEYKSSWSQNNNFLPLYPSINYFYIDKATKESSINKNDEVRWFDESTYLFVDTEDTFVIECDQKNNPKTIEKLIKEYLTQRYHNHVDAIFNLYEYESNYEYSNLTDTNNYKYTMKLTLK